MRHTPLMCERHSLPDLSRVAQEAGQTVLLVGLTVPAVENSWAKVVGTIHRLPSAHNMMNHGAALGPWLIWSATSALLLQNEVRFAFQFQPSREHRHCGPDTSCFLLFPRGEHATRYRHLHVRICVCGLVSGATETEKDRQRRRGLISAGLCQ